MKNIIISADGDRKVYSVPDAVAENLEVYCIEFCNNWLWTSPNAAKYRRGAAVCYNEDDFIAYLNEWVFPAEKSVLVENLGCLDFNEVLPERYQECSEFCF